MTDYIITGRQEDSILTNLRCWNCQISLSLVLKSEYEKDGYRCPGCGKIQINKYNIRDKYSEYLASYHGINKPLTREEWNKKSTSDDKQLIGGEWIKDEEIINQSKPPNPKDQIGITKLPLHLIPAPALARLSKVMELGARKYGAYNWRQTEINLTIYLSAALRHLYSILDGENIDIESNQHHATHVMACMAIILDAIELNKLIDDRPPPGNFSHLVTQLQEKLND